MAQQSSGEFASTDPTTRTQDARLQVGAGLIADKKGALYGTTNRGGSGGFFLGFGTVFKLTSPANGQTAWTETVLYSFKGGSDGANPSAGLIASEEGALYGTTVQGGTIGAGGTVFKLTPPAKNQTAWTETVLYSFCSMPNCSDGANPSAGLIADKHGALYGTTTNRGMGPFDRGTVFKLTPPAKDQTAWTETVLHSFTGGSDGAFPFAGLIAGEEGALYEEARSTALNAAVDGPSGRRHSFSPITEGRLAPPGLAGRRRGCARRGLQNFVPRDVIQECNKGGIDRSVRSASLSKIKPL